MSLLRRLPVAFAICATALLIGNAAADAAKKDVRRTTPGLVANCRPWEPPAKAVHIDPANKNDPAEDGSLAHPFDSLADVAWTNGTAYAIRRGTTLETEAFNLNGEDIVLASYGRGPRPVIRCTSVAKPGENKHAIRVDHGKNLIFRDLEIDAPKATSCLRLGGQQSENITVVNCKLHGPIWGLRSFGFSGLKVLSTELFDHGDDGLFIKRMTNIEIAYCSVHDVNQHWIPPYTPQGKAAGDCIQLSGCNDWHVHHNVLDRTNSGNKFCFISNNPKQDKGLFEHNITRGPLTTGDGGAAIYLHDGDGVVVRYNMILGPAPTGLYSHASNLRIHGNVFAETSGGIFVSKSAEVFNNLFYRQSSPALSGGTLVVVNNIFDLAKGVVSPFGRIRNLTKDHNLQTRGTSTSGSRVGNPRFVAPEKLDFHVRADSSCIDAGRDVGIERDMDGTPIPRGKAPDIGPFER